MVKRTKGGAYSFGSSAVAPEAPYAQIVVPGPQLTPDCLEATRPGLLGPVEGSGGLPGFAGGAAKSFGITRGMAGGRYMVDVGTNVANPNGSAGPSLGNYATITRIPCESSTSTVKGGAANHIENTYYASTAGYDNKPSEWVGSTGAQSLVQIPYDAKSMNPACVKTGGVRRYRKKTRKTVQKKRKTRQRK